MSIDWKKKKKNDKADNEEEAKLNEALYEFQVEFGQGSSAAQPKTFVRGDVIEGNKSLGRNDGSNLYAPKAGVSIAPNVGSTNFDEAKKLAAAKARRMLEDAAKNKKINIVPKVVVPSTKLQQPRPPRPGSLKHKETKPKVSNLELFKQELQKVQEDRVKRKDLRNQLESVGMDAAVVDRIAPSLNKPYLGEGEFDNDPFTTNLYISNLLHHVTEQDLKFTFGSYGPLASLKVLYPRSEEEKRRPHICAFVAYMSRNDLDRMIAEIKILLLRDEPVKIAMAKPVAIPPAPFYVPPQLQRLRMPDPITYLPFNAKPIAEQAEEFLAKYGSFPPLHLAPTKGHNAYDDYMKLIQNATVRVVIPNERRLLRLINRMAVYVVTEGAHFEAMIMAREANNPLFRFLFDNCHPAHAYYRWRMFTLLQGCGPFSWRRTKFRMFENGSWWLPPKSNTELGRSMPECLYFSTCIKTHPEKWCQLSEKAKQYVEETKSAAKGDRRSRDDRKHDRRDDRGKASKKETPKKDSTYLPSKSRRKLEKMLRELIPEQEAVGQAMLWCVEHSKFAKEIAECIYESLTIDSTPLHKKIARLYLVNDILANCVQRSVRDVFYYRSHFEKLLEKIFIALAKTHRSIETRIKQETFKQRVMSVFGAWEDAAIYTLDKLINCQNIFLGLVGFDKEEPVVHRDVIMKKSPEYDSDLDGVPINDDIDGVPIDEQELTKAKFAPAAFKPAFDSPGPEIKRTRSPERKRQHSPYDTAFGLKKNKWDSDNSDNDEPKSKWDRESEATDTFDTSTVKINNQGKFLEDGERSSPEEEQTSRLSIQPQDDENRRRMMREMELKAMELQDELEAKRDNNVKMKLEIFRKEEMERIEKSLAKMSKKKEKVHKSSERRSKSDRKDRSRSRDRDRRDRKERSRSRDRDRDRYERDRERDRDRDRDRKRDRSRDRERDRRR